jgi:RNA polymerase sigma factor (sigma-70 family)
MGRRSFAFCVADRLRKLSPGLRIEQTGGVPLGAEQVEKLAGIYRAHHARVFRTCLRFGTGDREWAKDRTHDVFIKLSEHLGELEKESDPGGWLYRVAVHTCFMALRRQRTWGRIRELLSFGAEESTPSAENLVRSRRDLGERAIVVLVHLEDKTQTEAGELLGLSKGQISKLHARAIAKLRARDWDVT